MVTKPEAQNIQITLYSQKAANPIRKYTPDHSQDTASRDTPRAMCLQCLILRRKTQEK